MNTIEYNASWIKITGKDKLNLPYQVKRTRPVIIPNTPYNFHYIMSRNTFKNIKHKQEFYELWHKNYLKTDNQNRKEYMETYKTNQAETANKIKESLKQQNINFYDFLYDHQVITSFLALKNCSYGMFLQQGTGKTFAALQVADIRLQKKHTKAVLIVCPANIVSVWENELNKLYLLYKDPRFKPCTLYDTSLEVRQSKLMNSKAKFFIINYDVLFKMKDTILKHGGINMLIFDESTAIKNREAKVTQAAMDLARHVRYKLLLTGTPIANTPLDLHSQVAILENSSYYLPFNLNYFAFRNKYFKRWNDSNWSKWYLKKGCDKTINTLLYTMAIRYTREECLTLPPLVFQDIYCPMSPEQKEIYIKIKNRLLSQLDNLHDPAKQLNVVMKLPQITTGFIFDTDHNANWMPVPEKLNTCLTLIEEINDKVVVFARFRPTLERLKKELGNKAELYYGGINKTQKDKTILNFTKGDTQVLLVQLQSGSKGLNLQENCSNVIFIERDYSPVEFDQAVARIYRQGQKQKTIIYNLICKNTIDMHLIEVYKDKCKTSESVLKTILTGLVKEEAS